MGQIDRKQLARNVRAEALIRMEEAARTLEDFQAVVAMWDHLDRNRQRKERAHEIGRTSEEMLHWDRLSEDDEQGKLREELDIVIPRPMKDLSWKQLMRGKFLDLIYDNAEEMWQLIADWDIAPLLFTLTNKQREVLFYRAVRCCTPQQIACYQDKTDRAVRKLLAAALARIRDQLAFTIREKIDAEVPDMTWMKRTFLAWYEQQKVVLDSSTDKE
ncbi:MAG: hypothetical protein FWF10_04910 [Clostridiales bacterium]|nr:hypothetical protein [Clostridiales bacterium]